MKLEVGKTYKDRRGHDVVIVAKDTVTNAAAPYIGAYGARGSLVRFQEDGTFPGAVSRNWDLLPNTRKVTKYVALRQIGGGNVQHSNRSLGTASEAEEYGKRLFKDRHIGVGELTYEVEE